jgi:uncharacterized protein YbcI
MHNRKMLRGFYMGYYSSLIQRKFKDLVGSRYEEIRTEYSDFLVSEEEMKVKTVTSVLIPVDVFVKELPEKLTELLAAYGARVHLVYIIDRQTEALIGEMVGEERKQEFIRKKEDYGRGVLDLITKKLESKGLSVQKSLFSGSKTEDVLRMSREYDLVALSRNFGAPGSENIPLSPTVSHIDLRTERSVVIY